MARYRKKPVEVEAVQFTGTGQSCDDVTAFLGGYSAGDTHQWKTCTNDGGYILTREGPMEFVPGDWIIREPFPTEDRRFYLCKPDIFEATYEPA